MTDTKKPSVFTLDEIPLGETYFSDIKRGVPYARVFTAQSEPILPAVLADALEGRGFVPGFTDPAGETPALQDAGLADARFTVGGEGYRIVSLSSSRGEGCQIMVRATSADQLPDDYLARRTVPKPKLVYLLRGGGLSNSDRNLAENIAEALLLLTNGLVEIGGRGVKGGNRTTLYDSFWLGSIRRDH
jgi:hypothetical protein